MEIHQMTFNEFRNHSKITKEVKYCDGSVDVITVDPNTEDGSEKSYLHIKYKRAIRMAIKNGIKLIPSVMSHNANLVQKMFFDYCSSATMEEMCHFIHTLEVMRKGTERRELYKDGNDEQSD